MADRIYGIQQGQPADVVDFFKSRNRAQDLPLVQHIYEVSTLKANAAKPRATDGYDLLFGDKVDQYVDYLADGTRRIYRKIHLFVVGHGTPGAFDKATAFARLEREGYSLIEGLGEGTDSASLLTLTGESDNGQYANLDNYLHFAIRAAGPRYQGEPESSLSSRGGYEFTGAFSDRVGANEFGTLVAYTQDMVDNNRWMRFGFSDAARIANDVPYFPVGNGHDETKGLFGGKFMPDGVTDLFDFGYSSAPYSNAVETGDFQYTAANGSFDLSGCVPGDFIMIRFDFNIVPQIANTTIEVALIWQTFDSAGNAADIFPLTTQPIFYGQGTVGKTYLNRPLVTAYLASQEDVQARALLAVRSDNPVQIAPLTTLCTINR